jgi:hypothetical protein
LTDLLHSDVSVGLSSLKISLEQLEPARFAVEGEKPVLHVSKMCEVPDPVKDFRARRMFSFDQEDCLKSGREIRLKLQELDAEIVMKSKHAIPGFSSLSAASDFDNSGRDRFNSAETD